MEEEHDGKFRAKCQTNNDQVVKQSITTKPFCQINTVLYNFCQNNMLRMMRTNENNAFKHPSQTVRSLFTVTSI